MENIILLLVIIFCIYYVIHLCTKNNASKSDLQVQSNWVKTSIYKTYDEIRKQYDNDNIPYKEMLKCLEWKQKKTLILQRDNYTCQCCKTYFGSAKKTKLNVHHMVYRQFYKDGKYHRVLPWYYPDNELVTLCESCHKQWHQENELKIIYN